jgi:DNA polymerase-3 subunit epsilon
MALDFVALDFETAGLDRGTPCGIGLVKFRDGQVVDTYEQLLKPVPRDWDPQAQPLESFFHPMCVDVHGIRPADVADSPAFWEAWPQLQAFLAGLPVVAHNAAFDMGVLRASLDYAGEQWPSIDYGCTLVWGRRTYDLASYRLPFIAEAAGVQFSSSAHHGALYDADVAGKVLLDIAAKNDASNLQALTETLGTRLGELRPDMWRGCCVKSHGGGGGAKTSAKDAVINADADPDHPLYGMGVTFTGALASMTRADAQQLVANFGGQPLDSVSKKTNLLVFGEQDASKLRPGAKQSSKYEKAVSLRAAGAAIEVISEADFLTLVADSSTSGTR